MEYDKEGFLYPKIDTKLCVMCGLCERSCPILAYRGIAQTASPQVYAAVNRNKDTYLRSASGGLFFPIAEQIICSGGIVCGAEYDEVFNVHHSFAESLEDCCKFQSSKYTQSDIIGIYRQIKQYLKTRRKVLFTGTPCQVAGLRKFLQKDYTDLYCVDIICHGVPSPMMFHDYLKFLSRNKRITKINFKYKINGIPKTSLRVDFSDGSHVQNCLKTYIWDRLYFGHYAIRPSCHDCPFTHFNRTGDITIGDFWGLRKYHSDFHPTECPSLLLVNNDKGKWLFEAIGQDIDFIRSCPKEALQPQLKSPTIVSPNRDAFWKLYESKGFQAIARQYGGYTTWKIIKDHIKSYIVTKL